MNNSYHPLVNDLISGRETVQPVSRRALAKIITLLESTKADHRRESDQILNELMPLSGQWDIWSTWRW